MQCLVCFIIDFQSVFMAQDSGFRKRAVNHSLITRRLIPATLGTACLAGTHGSKNLSQGILYLGLDAAFPHWDCLRYLGIGNRGQLNSLALKSRYILPCKSWELWVFAVCSDTFAKYSINIWCAMNSVQCVVWSVHAEIQGHLQVPVQCVMNTVQCAGCSVLPVKLWNRMSKKKQNFFLSPINNPSVFFKYGLRIYVFQN